MCALCTTRVSFASAMTAKVTMPTAMGERVLKAESALSAWSTFMDMTVR